MRHLCCVNCGTYKPKRLTGAVAEEVPMDVPPGHLAVLVGKSGRRFVIRADYLNHPIFRDLLDAAYEEYGHYKEGLLELPCDEHLFQDILRAVRSGATAFQSSCQGTLMLVKLAYGKLMDLLHAKVTD